MSEPPMDQEHALARLDALVSAPDGLRWLELLHRLKSRDPVQAAQTGMVDELVDLSICGRDSAGITLTAFGSKCADSAREYLFWMQRNRKLPAEGSPPIVLENFRDKDLLEVGPGWGCNLIPLSAVARRAVGVEIEPVYIAFSRILAKREGMRAPEIRRGTAESIPFGPSEFDWVLLFSVLQYIDPRAAFYEMHRVLRAGGLVLTIQTLLPQFIGYRLRLTEQSRNPRLLLSTASIITNTLWYQYFGRRLRDNIVGDSTARPIQPTRGFLVAAAAQAGLHFRSDLSTPLGHEFVFVFQKPS